MKGFTSVTALVEYKPEYSRERLSGWLVGIFITLLVVPYRGRHLRVVFKLEIFVCVVPPHCLPNSVIHLNTVGKSEKPGGEGHSRQIGFDGRKISMADFGGEGRHVTALTD